MTRLHCRNFWFVLVVAAATCLPATAETAPDPDKPTHAQHMMSGDCAQFDGQLLSTGLSIDLGLKADSCDRLIDIEVGAIKKELELDLKLEKNLRGNDVKSLEDQLKAMEKDRDGWKAAARVPFYEKPWFVALLTAGVIGSIVIGTAQLSWPGRSLP